MQNDEPAKWGGGGTCGKDPKNNLYNWLDFMDRTLWIKINEIDSKEKKLVCK